MIARAYKFKAYPTKDQMQMIETNCNAHIKAWNLALELHEAYYELHRKDPSEEMEYAHSILHKDGQKTSLTSFDLGKMVKVWKDTVCPWFGIADAHSTRSAVKDLSLAFEAFYRRVKRGETPGYPKYKSMKSNEKSYRTQNTRCKRGGKEYESIRVIDDTHILMPKLGPLKCRGDLSRIDGRLQNVTVRKCASGRYEISVCCVDCPEPEMPMGMTDVLGVRLGVRELATRSDGVTIDGPKALSKYEKKLAREQRRLSRKKKGSNNYKKQRKKLAKVHEKVANVRRNATHQMTKQAVRDSRAIAVGRPDVKNMLDTTKGNGRKVRRAQNKALLDSGIYETTRQLEYKCGWYGRDFIALEGGLPWTITCSRCGAETGPKVPGVKSWTCPECGTTHDTAMNAARNIGFEGAARIEMSK